MVQRFWRSAPRYLLEELLEEVMMDIRRIVVYYRTYYDEKGYCLEETL